MYGIIKLTKEKGRRDTVTDMLKISQSKAKTWRRCHFEFHCKYVLNLEKKMKAVPLVTGTVIHSILEAMALGKDWAPVIEDYAKDYNKLFAEEQDKYKSPEDLDTIMRGYEKYWKDEPLRFIKINGKRAEHEFEIKLCSCDAGDIMFEGKVDAYIKDKLKRRWIVEHKSFKKLPEEDVRFTDVQSTAYSWVWEELGYPVDGVLWDYIRSKPPVIPETLKSGGLTQRANIDSTYDTYYKTILDNGLDPEDYIKILENLRGKEGKFYRRIWMPSPKPIIKTIISELRETALEIAYLGETVKTRNINLFNCRNCSYYSLCQADLRGLDKEFIIEREYKERRKEDEEDGSEEEND